MLLYQHSTVASTQNIAQINDANKQLTELRQSNINHIMRLAKQIENVDTMQEYRQKIY